MKRARTLRLLPTSFKTVGMVVMVLAIASLVLVKVMHVQIDSPAKELLRILTVDLFLVGLLSIAFARDRMEDEMTTELRIRSMASAFLFAVIFVMVMPIISLVAGDPIEDMKGQQVIMTMLIIYLLRYYTSKRRMV
jgi:hypothetical protein